MHSTTRAARTRRHLSHRERQRLARAAAFSRRTPTVLPAAPPAKLQRNELELIDRLVRRERTAVSCALLAIAGIEMGAARRRAVLVSVSEATCWAQAEGAISANRAAQIARDVERALGGRDQALAACAERHPWRSL